LCSGVPHNDDALVNITRGCREAAFSTASTYELSLLIMFFDRLGHKADTPMIQFLTLRLMSGQSHDGSWSYSCTGLVLDPVQERQLRAALVGDNRLTTPDRPRAASPPKEKGKPREDLDDSPKPKTDPKKDKETPPAPAEEPKEPKEDRPTEKRPRLHPGLEGIAAQIGRGAGVDVATGDHSNTQFATVGLWCGRRHGVDVTASLAAIDKHYRGIQGADGGWSYTTAGGFSASSPAMTCAGLMGLALGFGAKNLKEGADREPRLEDPEALNKDKKVMDGLKYVGDFIAAAGAQRAPAAPGGIEFPQANELSNNLYFMWSLERVGMVYGLTTIGNVDWYDWGSNILVRTQQRNGSWRSDGFHSGSDDSATAFALLFLCRANLTDDLSSKLGSKVKDPGTSRLSTPDLSKIMGTAAKPSTGTTKSEAETKVAKLVDALVVAGPGDREVLLAKYRDEKGGEYSDALALAAAKLKGDRQTEARAALVQRLNRMKPNTLIDYMKDRDRELRRAAVLAAASKGKDRLHEVAEALIARTADEDANVSQAARTSLKKLTNQDFGPESGDSASDRAKAMLAWRKWWDGQK
ncbi:MAG TPA: hypothetical protein VKE40_16350, partial [Gemmataceae bacterium]|nr:hypothetical protein [Gemmataceae bacterium]